jgi:chloramphenicol-sensitive protein RarD
MKSLHSPVSPGDCILPPTEPAATRVFVRAQESGMPPRDREPLSSEGVAFALLAYTVWGFAAIYWKWMAAFPASELLAYRVLASMCIALLLVAATGAGSMVRQALKTGHGIRMVLAASALIATNWLVFIYAVQTDRILETSLGYYINPLVNVLFGMLLLGERLTRPQGIAVALAAGGVATQTLMLGSLPWISLVLATSFGLYGLVRKTAPVEPLAGYALETVTLAPAALAFLGWLAWSDQATIPQQPLATWAGVAASGLITAVPLLSFASAARRLPLSTLGMFQYLAPTIAFGLAVLLYDERVTLGNAISFGCVWLALGIFAWDSTRSDTPTLAPSAGAAEAGSARAPQARSR